MTRLGYARVSSHEQTHELQLQALQGAGCDRVWTEIASGASTGRPELAALLDYARSGDTIVVWKLDRMGRSLGHLVQVLADLDRRGIGFVSLTEGMDTTTAAGRLLFHVVGALAEFERSLIRERTAAGLAAARKNGRVGGRKSTVSPLQLRTALQLLDEGKGPTFVARAVGISRQALARALERAAVRSPAASSGAEGRAGLPAGPA